MTVTQHAGPSVPTLDNIVSLVRAEFQEMPGMRLTFAQARRLWNLSAEDCTRVLGYLVSSGILARDDDERFCKFES